MKRVRSALLLPLLLLWGCDFALLTGPGSDSLDFSWEPADHGQWLEQPEIDVAAETGEITITTKLSTPDPCQRLEGDLERAGSDLTLWVRVVRVGEGCYQMIGTFRYTAVVRGLAPGGYELRVVHEYPGTGWSAGVVLEEAVAVD